MNKQNEPRELVKIIEEEIVSPETQKEIAEKYDSDSATRDIKGLIGYLVMIIALSMAVFHLYTSGFGLLETLRQRAAHLAFVLPLAFLLYPAFRNRKTNQPTFMDYLLAILSVISAGYVVFQYKEILLRGGMPMQVDIIMGILTTILVLEAVRRVVGKELAIIALVFLVYGYFGPFMPGIFAHKGASLSRLIDHLYMIPEGIFSIALGTSATYIVLFIIFATFLEKSGLGIVIQDLSLALAGTSSGGPAKVAIVTSACFGSINGSAAANVVTTGAFTIPLMKRIGYQKEFAAGVEAVSSTAGQLMPPIMGSAAFIMADYMGIPYLEVVKAAIIPVLLYYTGVFTMVHIRAKKLGLQGLPKELLPKALEVLKKRGHLLVPLVLVIVLLVMRYTPLFVGFWGIIFTVIAAALKKETRMSFKDILWALETGAKRTVPVAIATACVGLVIGICTLTGVSSIISNYILNISQGYLMVTLFMVMLLSILMGMGLPTVAVYVLLATVAVPVIANYNVPMLAAHFFVFYFGLMANVTPPVAIPAYAAAGLANANPSKVGWVAFKLALAGFIVPYMFIMSPELLLIDFTWLSLLHVGLTSILGVVLLGIAVENYLLAPLWKWQRLIILIGSLSLINPGLYTDFVGVFALLIVVVMQKQRKTQAAV